MSSVVFVLELPGNAVDVVDYEPHIKLKPWPVPCPAEALRESEAERSWILTYPFSLGSVPEVSCGFCISRQGLGCPGPCPPATQADQLCGLPRRSPASPPTQRWGWRCRGCPSKAGHLLFSGCLSTETLSAPYVLNGSGRTRVTRLWVHAQLCTPSFPRDM